MVQWGWVNPPKRTSARLLFSTNSYTRSRLSSRRQQPFNFTKFLWRTPVMRTTSLRNSSIPCWDLPNRCFTANMLPSGCTPYHKTKADTFWKWHVTLLSYWIKLRWPSYIWMKSTHTIPKTNLGSYLVNNTKSSLSHYHFLIEVSGRCPQLTIGIKRGLYIWLCKL